MPPYLGDHPERPQHWPIVDLYNIDPGGTQWEAATQWAVVSDPALGQTGQMAPLIRWNGINPGKAVFKWMVPRLNFDYHYLTFICRKQVSLVERGPPVTLKCQHTASR